MRLQLGMIRVLCLSMGLQKSMEQRTDMCAGQSNMRHGWRKVAKVS